MNYKGRINSEFNLVNKGYVDNELPRLNRLAVMLRLLC